MSAALSSCEGTIAICLPGGSTPFPILERLVESGVDWSMDVHGDEAIPACFIAGFHGIPSWTDRQGELYDAFLSRLEARTPDFQTALGYPRQTAGKANLTMSTNQLAERFGAVSMTLEMPFKDHRDNPDPVHGWSAERSMMLARECIATLSELI